MAEKTLKTNWKPTDTRFVAFFDLLGFKDKIMRKTHDEIYSELNKFSNWRKNIEKTLNNDIVIKNFIDVDVYIVSFSDSIVLFSKNDSLDNFKFFTLAINSLFSNSIKNNIAIKGGIAHGIISINKSEQIYFGQPIIDAYLIEEDVNYLGVVCHNSIDVYLKNLNSTFLDKHYKFLEAPLKSGYINHYVLDYFYLLLDKGTRKELKREEKIELIENVFKEFYCNVSGSARRYVDNTLNVFKKMDEKNMITLESIYLKD